MNSRKLFIFIFLCLGAFIWFQLKQKKNEHVEKKTGFKKALPAPAKQTPRSNAQEVGSVATNKEEVTDPHNFTKCYKTLWNKFKVDECDSKCFANYLENHDEDLAKLISEKWTDESVSGRRAYSQLGLFFRALQNAGMKLDPLPPEKVDMDMALAQISQLGSDDPGNGYPLLFTALLYKIRGREEDAVQYLRAASEAPRFDSYIGKISMRLRMAAADNPRMGLKALETYSQLPFPDYRKLEDLIGLDDKAFGTILQRMTSKGVEVGGKGFSLNWEPLEHQTAIYVLRKFSPNEAEKIPSYHELLEKDQSLGVGSHWQFNEETCNEEDFIEELQREKLFLQTLN
jgi:hypothetical protein